MNIIYHGKEYCSPAIESLCNKKLDKLNKLDKDDPFTVDIFLSKSGREYEMRITAVNKIYNLVAKAKNEDMYKNIDACIDIIKAQLVESKPQDKVHRAK